MSQAFVAMIEKIIDNQVKSGPLVWVTLFYAAGIWSQSLGLIVLAGMFIVCLGIGFLFTRQIKTGILLVVFWGLGALSAAVYRMPAEDDIMYFTRSLYGQPVTLQGIIRSDITRKKFFRTQKMVFTMELRRIKTSQGWQDVSGKILVHLFQSRNLVYGHPILIEGKLHRPYHFSKNSHFSYPRYLSHKNIYYILSVSKRSQLHILGPPQGHGFLARAFQWRHQFRKILDQNLSYHEAGIMKAILLGDRSHIPKRVRTLFAQTGTAHILAISGLHIVVVAAVCLMFFRICAIARRWCFVATMAVLIGYAILTGARASVVRATVMACVFLGGFILERESHARNTLAVAALVLLIMNPLNLFDPGFQFSFFCVLAIIFFHPPLFHGLRKRIPWKNQFIEGCLQTVSVSAAVFLGIAGLTAYYFNIMTPVAVLANVLIVPFVLILVSLGLAMLLSGLVIPAGLFFITPCLKVSLNIMAGLAFLLAKIPYAYIPLKTPELWMIVMYYAVLIILYKRKDKSPKKPIARP